MASKSDKNPLQFAISELVEHRDLTERACEAAMQVIMEGQASPAEVAGFAIALRMKGESVEEVTGAARAMRSKLTRVDAGPGPIVDTAGTGGDGAGSFNISTTAAFIAAGAGVKLAKHGNRSVSSRCGSADLLAALGVKIDCSVEVMETCLRELGMAFLFAPSLHPAMKYAAAPRRELGVRTLFNLLGPLVNPAFADRQLVGVFAEKWLSPMAQVLGRLGIKRAFVVHGEDGLDEISLTAKTHIVEWDGAGLRSFEIDPRELGLELCDASELEGGDVEENAAITLKILRGEAGPRREVSCLNAAAALVLGDKAESFEEGLKLAHASIDEGRAFETMQQLVACSNR